MAHCISLDETIPKKSIDVATNNVTHIHYGNSSEQYNNSQVGCYRNAETYTATESCSRNDVYKQYGQYCWGCHESTATYWLFPSSHTYIGFECSNCGSHSPSDLYERQYFSRTYTATHYKCPYTAGTTVMSIGVMHLDKAGSQRTLTINFDDQITSAGSVISYAWNTGATTQSITVNQRGTYYCDVTWQETQSQVNHTVRLTYTF